MSFRPLSGSSRPRSRALAAALSLALLLPAAASGPLRRANAQPSPAPGAGETTATASPEGTGSALERESPSVPLDGTLDLTVRTSITTDTAYYEARFQVLRPGGGVMLQKTEIRHDLAPGDTRVAFSRELGSLGLRPAAYPVRIRVRFEEASGRTVEHVVEDTVFLYDPDRPPLPVAIVVRLSSAPSLDPESRFVVDPALYGEEREQAQVLARELGSSREKVSLALPPVLLDEWRRAADGYLTVGPEGVREVPAEDETPRAYGSALRSLASLAQSEHVELLDVPYAEPDLLGLDAADAAGDLARHFAQGITSYIASIDETPVAGTVLLGDRLPASALPSLARRGISFAVVPAGALSSQDASVPPGVHRIRETTLTALALDEATGERLAADPRSALDALFERYSAEGEPAPVAALLEMGPGREADAARVSEALALLGGTGWIRTVSASEAAASPGRREVSLRDDGPPGPQAPADYWPQVGEARDMAAALSSAAGDGDPDAEAAWYLALLAESGAWAGPDGSWSLADRGRAFAGAARRRAGSVLDGVTLQAKDVTLSGRDGEVPVNVSNRTRRKLDLTMRLESDRLALPQGAERVVELNPSDNYLTFPVDLRSALAGELRISLYAGEERIAEADVTVRASYIDRVVIVSGVVLILLGMLFYIKRRVNAADADIIDDGEERRP